MKVSASIHLLFTWLLIGFTILLAGSLTPVEAEMSGRNLAFLRSCTPLLRGPNSEPTVAKTSTEDHEVLATKKPSTPLLPSPNSEPTVAKRSTEDYEALGTRAINRFALALYEHLEKKNGNLVFSPFSAYAPLAMAYGGATGKTKKEMTEVLSVKQAGVPIHSTVGWLAYDLSHLAARDGGQLHIATGIWAHQNPDYAIREQYRKMIKANYGVDIRMEDFLKDPAAVVRKMNQWVEEKTEGKITDIVTVKDLLPEPGNKIIPCFVLLNAIYFKCLWAVQFNRRATKDEDFTLLDGTRVKTPMMHKTSGDYQYMETERFQALEMLYKGGGLSMVVFLPRKTDGLRELEESLSAEELSAWLSRLSKVPGGVQVTFPKFKMESALKLIPALQASGMTTAFRWIGDPRETFAELVERTNKNAEPRPLFIEDVLQKAWIEITEKGTEAAATTKFTFKLGITGAPPKPVIFKADHPFLFMIVHKQSKCILFMGRVTDPKMN